MNIVIIGSSSVIGTYLAERLLQVNHRLFLFSRPECDVTKLETLKKCAQKVQHQTHVIHALIVMPATVVPIGRSTGINMDLLSHSIDTNLKGPLYALSAFYPLLKKSRRPKIIFFSGGGATKGRPNFLAYAASKAGLVRSVETIAAEDPSMDINAIAPGAIKSPLTDLVLSVGPQVAGPKEYADAEKFTTKGLPEIYNLVDFLLLPKSDGVSGLLIAAQHDRWHELRATNIGNDEYRLRRTLGQFTKP